MSKDKAEQALEALQEDLVSSQIWSIENELKLLIIFEGRDAAGKDGALKRVTENLSVRNTRVVALPKPSDRERTQWYFQRYVAHLPAAAEWVMFNRSWYNRAGVERVLGFSTAQEQEQFLRDAPVVERMLTQSGMQLIKFWLDISREEQAERLKERRTDPVKRLKVSPLDAVAQDKWDAYSEARNDMLMRTHSDGEPWWCVRADDKKAARLNIALHLLRAVGCPTLSKRAEAPDPAVLFPFEPQALTDGRLAP